MSLTFNRREYVMWRYFLVGFLDGSFFFKIPAFHENRCWVFVWVLNYFIHWFYNLCICPTVFSPVVFVQLRWRHGLRIVRTGRVWPGTGARPPDNGRCTAGHRPHGIWRGQDQRVNIITLMLLEMIIYIYKRKLCLEEPRKNVLGSWWRWDTF